jgi:hypothetical protein
MILNVSSAAITLNSVFRLKTKIYSIAKIVKSHWSGFTRQLVPYSKEQVGGVNREQSFTNRPTLCNARHRGSANRERWFQATCICLGEIST